MVIVIVLPDQLDIAKFPVMSLDPVAALGEPPDGLLWRWPGRAVGDQVRWQQLMVKTAGAHRLFGAHAKIEDIDDDLEYRSENG